MAIADNLNFGVELAETFKLRSHMDIVRGLYFVPEVDTMASISEDCTVKLWSMRKMQESYNDIKGNFEPYFTMRGHTGPLFSITGSKNILYTAGSEG